MSSNNVYNLVTFVFFLENFISSEFKLQVIHFFYTFFQLILNLKKIQFNVIFQYLKKINLLEFKLSDYKNMDYK